jgi:2,3-bisphosphoglycerate-independent phosphoglycerate mutase
MSAVAVTDELVKAIEGQKFDVIVVNYANGNMVGHTGSIDAAVKAVEVVDGCVGRLLEALKKVDGCALFTADHGNCEDMLDENGKPKTAHTNTPVQAVLFNAKGVNELNNGKLADVAPTLLQLLNLPQPVEMTGKSLLKG